MWRSNFDADWERKKQYLIRSLFDDLILSPVPEEDESFDSTRSRLRAVYSPPSNIPAPRSTHDRPYSPLPPLIIEREQNRHDEPEEYYKQLEMKVLKVYRKLFIEGKETDDTSDSGETVDRLGTSLGRRTSFGQIEVSFDESHKSDDMSIEINGKSKKRAISEQDTDIETSDSKKSRRNDDNEVANRFERSTDEVEYSKLTNTQSSHSDNSINRGDVNEDEENDTISHTLSSYSANNNKRKNLEVENEVVEKLSDTSLYPADNSAESEKNISNTLSSHSDIVINTEKHNEDEEDDQVSDIMSSHPNSSNKVTGAEDSGDTPNHRDHRIVTFRADVHKEAADGAFVAPPVHQTVDDTVVQTADNVSDTGLVILENNEVSDHSHYLSQTGVPEVEVMRSTLIRHSAGSHNQIGVSLDTEASDTAIDLEPELEALTESDSDTDVNNTSRRKRSRSSNDSIYEVGTQTSFDCYERMSRGDLRDIFVGAPKVFRLCSCVNHACAF